MPPLRGLRLWRRDDAAAPAKPYARPPAATTTATARTDKATERRGFWGSVWAYLAGSSSINSSSISSSTAAPPSAAKPADAEAAAANDDAVEGVVGASALAAASVDSAAAPPSTAHAWPGTARRAISRPRTAFKAPRAWLASRASAHEAHVATSSTATAAPTPNKLLADFFRTQPSRTVSAIEVADAVKRLEGSSQHHEADTTESPAQAWLRSVPLPAAAAATKATHIKPPGASLGPTRVQMLRSPEPQPRTMSASSSVIHSSCASTSDPTKRRRTTYAGPGYGPGVASPYHVPVRSQRASPRSAAPPTSTVTPPVSKARSETSNAILGILARMEAEKAPSSPQPPKATTPPSPPNPYALPAQKPAPPPSPPIQSGLDKSSSPPPPSASAMLLQTAPPELRDRLQASVKQSSAAKRSASAFTPCPVRAEPVTLPTITPLQPPHVPKPPSSSPPAPQPPAQPSRSSTAATSTERRPLIAQARMFVQQLPTTALPAFRFSSPVLPSPCAHVGATMEPAVASPVRTPPAASELIRQAKTLAMQLPVSDLPTFTFSGATRRVQDGTAVKPTSPRSPPEARTRIQQAKQAAIALPLDQLPRYTFAM